MAGCVAASAGGPACAATGAQARAIAKTQVKRHTIRLMFIGCTPTVPPLAGGEQPSHLREHLQLFSVRLNGAGYMDRQMHDLLVERFTSEPGDRPIRTLILRGIKQSP